MTTTDTPLKDEVLNNPRALQMMEKYREWLNEFFKEQNKEDGTNVSPLQLEDFFTWEGGDGQRHPHGETRIVSDEQVTSFTKVVVMSCGYGDDGGPAALIGVFWRVEEDKADLNALIQEFDTDTRIIWKVEY